ncbi:MULTISPECIES: protein phosphatase 2C domain-containing protein [Actinomadura]|uniref:Protein phosphatase 2C domain-containing protein n=1 Tax=Actinomadura yumaensis TaxID=111807 RepID=A0ABW2CL85_9ACTN|nr:protein phosphatase 2C domain-containing protein [Actinomadura sp. J1-007]MWK37062.1 SpoIIE family protein phosphatase [Actinomadura sp. J1-007]
MYLPEPQIIGRPSRFKIEPGELPQLDTACPDTVLDAAQAPGLVIRAASARGDAHRYNAQPRQDAMGLWRISERILLACVADGLGSAELSHLGAMAACDAARGLRRRPDEQFKEMAERYFSRIAEAIEEAAAVRGVGGGELATTFLAAVLEVGSHGSPHKAWLMRVGDCEAMVLRNGEWTSCFFAVPEGEVSSSATLALPGHADQVEIYETPLEPGDVLLLCTDGLSKPMRGEEVRTQLAGWWGEHPPSMAEFLWQLSFRARTHDDDRTAICVWRA